MRAFRNKSIDAITQKGKRVRKFLGEKEIREGGHISS